MSDSGVDLAFDIAGIVTPDLDIDIQDLFEDESLFFTANGRSLKTEDFFYKLKSKTVPESPPSFKTATPTSRTQLKQQLMREKLQEEERREAAAAAAAVASAALSVPTPPLPLHHTLQGIDLPQQVLQVKTVLENPTRYHVIEKQRTQVRQYLSESLQPHPSQMTTGHLVAGGSASGPPTVTNFRPNVGASPETTAMSPGLSSIGTSASDVSTPFPNF